MIPFKPLGYVELLSRSPSLATRESTPCLLIPGPIPGIVFAHMHCHGFVHAHIVPLLDNVIAASSLSPNSMYEQVLLYLRTNSLSLGSKSSALNFTQGLHSAQNSGRAEDSHREKNVSKGHAAVV